MERERNHGIDCVQLTKKPRVYETFARLWNRIREPYFRYKSRRLTKSVADNLPQADFYIEALRQLGLPADKSYPIKCNYDTSGSLAKILKTDVGEGIDALQFVLYVSKKPLAEYDDPEWVKRVYEGMERLHAAREARLNERGKQFYRVPKPYSYGTLKIGRDDKEFGCIAMENLRSELPTFFAVDDRGRTGIMRIEPDVVAPLLFNPETYPADLEDVAKAHAITYRLLGGHFTTSPHLATGNYMTDRSADGHLSIAVTDIGPTLNTFTSDADWIQRMTQVEDRLVIKEKADLGRNCPFQPYGELDWENILQQADSMFIA